MEFAVNDRVVLLQDRVFANETVTQGTEGTVQGVDPNGPFYSVQFDGAKLPHIVPEGILDPA
jgi:hypothetical protein